MDDGWLMNYGWFSMLNIDWVWLEIYQNRLVTVFDFKFCYQRELFFWSKVSYLWHWSVYWNWIWLWHMLNNGSDTFNWHWVWLIWKKDEIVCFKAVWISWGIFSKLREVNFSMTSTKSRWMVAIIGFNSIYLRTHFWYMHYNTNWIWLWHKFVDCIRLWHMLYNFDWVWLWNWTIDRYMFDNGVFNWIWNRNIDLVSNLLWF